MCVAPAPLYSARRRLGPPAEPNERTRDAARVGGDAVSLCSLPRTAAAGSACPPSIDNASALSMTDSERASKGPLPPSSSERFKMARAAAVNGRSELTVGPMHASMSTRLAPTAAAAVSSTVSACSAAMTGREARANVSGESPGNRGVATEACSLSTASFRRRRRSTPGKVGAGGGGSTRHL